MKNRIIRIVLRLFLLVSIGLLGSSISQTSPANAQGVDLDAILARSAVKG
jgi:hypothetical protein